jgi:hypothetical protein
MLTARPAKVLASALDQPGEPGVRLPGPGTAADLHSGPDLPPVATVSDRRHLFRRRMST